MNSKYAFSIISIAITLSLFATPAQAQSLPADNGLRLTTSPLPVSLSAKPGQTVTTDLRIRNSGSQNETFRVGLLTFSADGQGGGPRLRQRQTGDTFFDWVTFSDKEFTLASNQWHTTKMTIKVPQEAAFGYYYAATFTRIDKNASPDNPDQAVLIGSTATLVLLEVESPNAKRDITIEDFSLDQSWYEFLPANFTARLRNSGNVHAVASGDIFISRAGSKDIISTIPVNELKGNILPNSVRAFQNSWTEGFPKYDQPNVEEGETAKPNLQWDFSQADQLRAGKYSAHLVLAYDDGSKDVPLEASLDFWVIPWRIILAVIAVGGLSLFGLLMIGKSIWRLFRKPKTNQL